MSGSPFAPCDDTFVRNRVERIALMFAEPSKHPRAGSALRFVAAEKSVEHDHRLGLAHLLEELMVVLDLAPPLSAASLKRSHSALATGEPASSARQLATTSPSSWSSRPRPSPISSFPRRSRPASMMSGSCARFFSGPQTVGRRRSLDRRLRHPSHSRSASPVGAVRHGEGLR